MPRTRTTARELASVLETSDLPLYVVDEQREIVFGNRALGQLLGVKVQELIGQRCDYHWQEGHGTLAATVASLCPPPEVFAGKTLEAEVSVAAPDGQLLPRSGVFIPLADGADVGAPVLAILHPRRGTDPAEGAADSGPALHDQLLRFRADLKMQFGLETLVGTSAAIVRARAQALLAAKNSVNTLIVGSAGSGKEHLAKAIHYQRGQGSEGTLLPLACGLLSSELLGSTLQAMVARRELRGGREHDTLLLQDVGEMPPDVQADLDALLSNGSLKMPVISTSPTNLNEPVREGTLRAHLAAHLSTLVIELPPLAERLEDLPLLAQWFIEQANRAGKKQVGRLTPEAIDLLAAYHWPGNLDELAAIVREAHAETSSAVIAAADLPHRVHFAAGAQAHARGPQQRIVLEDFLARIETELIQRAMRRAGGNKSKAAGLLGLTRPRLYRRLVQLGLEQEGTIAP